MTRRVSVFGATGSVGTRMLDLIATRPHDFRVVALTADRNVEKLAELARKHQPECVVLADPERLPELRDALADCDVEIAGGAAALVEAAARPADFITAAIVGTAGLASTLEAAKQGGTLALANKESLVIAGDLLMETAAHHGTNILPADSEHNAVFQILAQIERAHVEKVVLTASGGPFYGRPTHELAAVSPREAAAHPNWSMGAKISIDSATLMNKGLELIEAKHLFGLEAARLDALIHPQSVVHALVHCRDGSVLAQQSNPDMRIPLAHCLAWPDRMESGVAPLDLAAIGTLTFAEADRDRFPCLALAEAAMQAGGVAPVALNAANEAAVAAFLAGEIGFLSIASVAEAGLNHALAHPMAAFDAVEDILAYDGEIRALCAEFIGAPQTALSS